MTSFLSGLWAFVLFVVLPIAVVVLLVGGIFALMFGSMSWKRADRRANKDGVLSGKHLPRAIISKAGPYFREER